MKKIIIIILAVIISIFIYNEKKEYTIIIPDSAIRLRVIPNSNAAIDQKMKIKVKKYLEDNTYKLLKDKDNIEDARKTIIESIPNIEDNINKIFKENNYDKQYRVEYGNNYFPEKEYRGVKYSNGYYESLVVSIGKAEGDNWWCVLFPNLCLVDLDKKDDMEYKIWVTEVIKKYFKKKSI